ncbi:MAG: 3-deoxy-8-phosphooctulonate synthase [Planctomycetota bacterium]
MSSEPQSPAPVDLGPFAIGGDHPLVLIAGPCVLETRDHALRHAEAIGAICARLGVPFVFKSSFDKANRTSIASYRGPGLDEGLRWLGDVRQATGHPVLTDVHEPPQAAPAAEVVDVLQIPAFLCRQTDLLSAATAGRPVQRQEGQFLSGADMRHPLQKLREAGSERVLLTERGNVFGFTDGSSSASPTSSRCAPSAPRSCSTARTSVQRPGGGAATTGGDRSLIAPLCRAAVAVGVDGLFLEVPPEDPDRAPSDGPNMLPLARLEPLLTALLALADGRPR